MKKIRNCGAAAFLTLGMGLGAAASSQAADTPGGTFSGSSVDTCSFGGYAKDAQGKFQSWETTFDALESHTYSYGPSVDIGSHLLGSHTTLASLDIPLSPEAVSSLEAHGFTTARIVTAEEHAGSPYPMLGAPTDPDIHLSTSHVLHLEGLTGLVDVGSWNMNADGRTDTATPIASMPHEASILTITSNGPASDTIILSCKPKQSQTSTTTSTAPTSTSTTTSTAPASTSTAHASAAPGTPLPPTITQVPSKANETSAAGTSARGVSTPPPTSSGPAQSGRGPRVETDGVSHSNNIGGAITALITLLVGATTAVISLRRRGGAGA